MGPHAGLRNLCRKAWGFESPLPHLADVPFEDGGQVLGHGA